MPRDFFTFANEHKNIINENKPQATEYEEILNKYKNMDSSELMSNLFSEASKLKKEGKLDSNSLNNLKSTLSPFLNAQQQELLGNLVNAINEQK